MKLLQNAYSDAQSELCHLKVLPSFFKVPGHILTCSQDSPHSSATKLLQDESLRKQMEIDTLQKEIAALQVCFRSLQLSNELKNVHRQTKEKIQHQGPHPPLHMHLSLEELRWTETSFTTCAPLEV